LQDEGKQPDSGAAVWIEWKPGIGWEVTVHQKNDEFRKTLIVPDNGGLITVAPD
jgi:hypothetical protein